MAYPPSYFPGVAFGAFPQKDIWTEFGIGI